MTSGAEATSPARRQPQARFTFVAVAAAYFALLTVLLFGVDLLWRPRAVVSAADMDVDRQFYAWRAFAFDEWRATGRPPLWNPYAFGGVPALGNFQYALLYPPNWLHFALPTTWAINLIAAGHVWLAGVLTAAWCRARGASSVACLIGGTIFTLSGPYLLHLYAGHLTYLCVVAWTPLVFLAVDAVMDRAGNGVRSNAPLTIMVGAIAVAMQILGGYPQPAFYTMLAVGCYVGVRLLERPVRAETDARSEPRRVRRFVEAFGSILAMYLLGAALAAAHLLPALDAARESVRAGGSEYPFAASYSLPPENLLTLVVPYPFGDDFSAPYRGRWVLWEMSLYVGGVAATLATCSFFASRGGRGRTAAAAGVLALAVLLALGAHTPVFRVLYELVPGVDRFRAPARFAFLAALMVAALAAAGFDAVRERRFLRRAIAGAAGVAAAALFAASLLAPNVRQLDVTALVFAQLAVILLLAGRAPRVAYLLPLLLLFEVWRPAARTIEWFRPRTPPPSLASVHPDERVLTIAEKLFNATTQFRIEDAWGYDPATSARWADLVGPLLGADARRGDFAPTRDPADTMSSPIWPLLRVRHVLPPTTTRPWDVKPMPRVTLVTDARVVDSPAASLAAVRAEDFDPRKTVILESAPNPAPQPGDGSPGVARVERSSADSLTIAAELSRPAVLLVTDAYAAGWRAQPPYRVVPANHALRAVALPAGRHRIVMSYRPPSFAAGVVISALAVVLTIGVGVASIAGVRRRPERFDPSADAA